MKRAFQQYSSQIHTAIAIGLLTLNLYSLPTPPAEAGLVDLGPLVGLWYLAVTNAVFASLRWARDLRPAMRTVAAP